MERMACLSLLWNIKQVDGGSWQDEITLARIWRASLITGTVISCFMRSEPEMEKNLL